MAPQRHQQDHGEQQTRQPPRQELGLDNGLQMKEADRRSYHEGDRAQGQQEP